MAVVDCSAPTPRNGAKIRVRWFECGRGEGGPWFGVARHSLTNLQGQASPCWRRPAITTIRKLVDEGVAPSGPQEDEAPTSASTRTLPQRDALAAYGNGLASLGTSGALLACGARIQRIDVVRNALKLT